MVTHMSRSFLSTAEHRREVVVASAIHVFAERGYLGTPTAAVAEHAGISSAYVFKLFPGKASLFVAALEQCYERVVEALEEGARGAAGGAEGALDAMGGSYAQLIADRDLLALQVHALSAADVPEIGDAVRAGTARMVRRARELSGATGDEVQRFIAWGQLCHLVVILGLDQSDADWARLLSHGLRHPDAVAPSATEGDGGGAD